MSMLVGKRFTNYKPADYEWEEARIDAILDYLDEEWEKKNKPHEK